MINIFANIEYIYPHTNRKHSILSKNCFICAQHNFIVNNRRSVNIYIYNLQFQTEHLQNYYLLFKLFAGHVNVTYMRKEFNSIFFFWFVPDSMENNFYFVLRFAFTLMWCGDRSPLHELKL